MNETTRPRGIARLWTRRTPAINRILPDGRLPQPGTDETPGLRVGLGSGDRANPLVGSSGNRARDGENPSRLPTEPVLIHESWEYRDAR